MILFPRDPPHLGLPPDLFSSYLYPSAKTRPPPHPGHPARVWPPCPLCPTRRCPLVGEGHFPTQVPNITPWKSPKALGSLGLSQSPCRDVANSSREQEHTGACSSEPHTKEGAWLWEVWCTKNTSKNTELMLRRGEEWPSMAALSPPAALLTAQVMAPTADTQGLRGPAPLAGSEPGSHGVPLVAVTTCAPTDFGSGGQQHSEPPVESKWTSSPSEGSSPSSPPLPQQPALQTWQKHPSTQAHPAGSTSAILTPTYLTCAIQQTLSPDTAVLTHAPTATIMTGFQAREGQAGPGSPVSREALGKPPPQPEPQLPVCKRTVGRAGDVHSAWLRCPTPSRQRTHGHFSGSVLSSTSSCDLSPGPSPALTQLMSLTVPIPT